MGIVTWAIDAELKEFKASVEDAFKEVDPAKTKLESERVVTILAAVMDMMKEITPEFEDLRRSVSALEQEREGGGGRQNEDDRVQLTKEARIFGGSTLDIVDDLSRMFTQTAVNVEGTPERGTSPRSDQGVTSPRFEEVERSVEKQAD